MNEHSMYAGAGLGLQGAMPQMNNAHAVDAFAGGDIAAASEGRARLLGKLGGDIVRMTDYKRGAQAQRDLNAARTTAETELNEGLAAAPGTAKSFFFEDGSRDEDKINDYIARTSDAYAAVDPGFVNPEAALRWREERTDFIENAKMRTIGQIADHELRSIRQAFEDQQELLLRQGDMGGAERNIRHAHSAGLISNTKMQSMLLGLAKRALRSAGEGGGAGSGAGGGSIAPVSIGGIMYDDGASAALAAEWARDGEGMEPGKSGEPGSLPLPPDESSAGVVVPDGAYEEAVPMADVADGADGNLGAFAGGGDTGSPLDAFFRSGDFGGVMPLVGQRDFADFTDNMGLTSICVRSCPQDDGRVVYSCSASAPEVVERAAAHANEAGELTSDDARAMVTNISFSLLSDNPDASNEQMSKVFDASGIFESLGDGDPEVGKVRALAIVEEVRQRAAAGTLKVSMETIEKVVDTHVDGLRIEERQADQLRYMDPKLDVKDKWDKSDLDEEGRRRWFALYEAYGKHRAEYLRDRGKEVPSTPLDKDEFEPLAQDFYDWFMPGAKARATARRAAVRDWYMAEIMRKLTDHVRSNNGQIDYGVSYANDMEVVRDVLQQEAPADLGENALMKMRTESALADKKRTDAYRKQAEEDFARLQALKSYTKEHDEKTQRAKKRAEDAEVRKREKEFAAQEKAEETRRARMLNAERMRPRRSEWVWDRHNAAFGESPACTIPEAQHRELVEKLGFDGSQVVYLQINGSKIRVDGVNKSGRIELNTPAVCKIQKKPNAKKGERWGYSGQLGYSYHFQTISSK